jgi:hypothetical protein
MTGSTSKSSGISHSFDSVILDIEAKSSVPPVLTNQPAIYTSIYRLIHITDHKLTPPKGHPDGATWAPWAERPVPFSVEVNDSSETPLRSEENVSCT